LRFEVEGEDGGDVGVWVERVVPHLVLEGVSDELCFFRICDNI